MAERIDDGQPRMALVAVRLLSVSSATTVLTYAALIALTGVTILPFIWMVATSLKPEPDILRFPDQLLPVRVTFDNYQNIWPRADLARLFANSVIFAGSVTLISVLLDSLAAFALARFQFRGRRIAFLIVILAIMIPFQTVIIPLYAQLAELGWINSYQGLIVPRATSAFGIFFLRQAFLSIPRDLDDAARVDGASSLGVYRHVMLPNSWPALLTIGLLHFQFNWNDLLWPLVVSPRTSMQTLPAGLASFMGEHLSEYGLAMTGATIAMVPIIVLFALVQRRFQEGIATTGIR